MSDILEHKQHQQSHSHTGKGCLRALIELPVYTSKELFRRATRTTRRIMGTTTITALALAAVIGFEKIGRYQELGWARDAWQDSLNNDGYDSKDIANLRGLMGDRYYFHPAIHPSEFGTTSDNIDQREKASLTYEMHLKHVRDIIRIIHLLADNERQLEEDLHVLPVPEYIRQLNVSLQEIGLPPGTFLNPATVKAASAFQENRCN